MVMVVAGAAIQEEETKEGDDGAEQTRWRHVRANRRRFKARSIRRCLWRSLEFVKFHEPTWPRVPSQKPTLEGSLGVLVDVIAVVGLARSVEEEAPVLATDLGLTPYEVAIMLRAPPPVIVARTEDRNRTLALLTKLRSRGHDAAACDLESITWSEDMFRPRRFRFEGSDFIGIGGGTERRLPVSDIFAFLRANHATRIEDTVEQTVRKLSLGRTALSGGLLSTRKETVETKRVTNEREAVLYLFPVDSKPWLLVSTQLRYDGLGAEMRISQLENFAVLLRLLRELAPAGNFDNRLLAVRASTNMVVSAGSKHLTSTSSGTMDILAHILASSLSAVTRPYR